MAKKGALEHPKTLTLADTLGIMDCFALGILEAFWHHVTDYFEDGNVTNLKPSVFCRSIRYQGNPSELWAALQDAGFIDVLPCGTHLVHDWAAHCNDYIHTKFFRALRRFADGTKPKAVSVGKDEKARLEEEWAKQEVPFDFEPEKSITEEEQLKNNSETVPEQLNNSLPNPSLPSLTKPYLLLQQQTREVFQIMKQIPSVERSLRGSGEDAQIVSLAEFMASKPDKTFEDWVAFATELRDSLPARLPRKHGENSNSSVGAAQVLREEFRFMESKPPPGSGSKAGGIPPNETADEAVRRRCIDAGIDFDNLVKK